LKVLVSGASGLLGWETADAFEEAGCPVVRLLGRKSVDIMNTREIIDFVKTEQPDLIVHSAGYRDLDDIEKHEADGFALNTFGTKNMALAASAAGSKLMYISSDTVYDGEKETGYHEYDTPNPVNIYGKSKLMAENEIRSLYAEYFIIRTAWLFGLQGHPENNVIYTLRDKLRAGQTISASRDQLCSPSYTKDIAQVLIKIAQTDYYGTYLVSNRGAASRYDVTLAIAEFLGLDTSLVIPADAGLIHLAKRARNTVFKPIAFPKTFGIEMEDWQDALKRCIDDLKFREVKKQ
jgi:dTDP-4-dehydrorhamnose reductase